MVMRADSYHIVSPGSPAPITFGMGNDPSQSMSLNPGAGSVGTFGSFGGGLGGGGAPAQAPSSIPQGWRPDSSLSVTNLAPVHVSAATMGGPMLSGDMYGGGFMGGMNLGSGSQGSKINVTDLAPVKVTAQLPRQPGIFEQAWMRQNDFRADHPLAYSAAKTLIGGAVPVLPTVMAFANAYQRWKHGQPLLGSTLGKLGGTVSGLFGSAPGGPLSSNDQNPLYKDLDSSFFNGSGSPLQSAGGSAYSDSQLPNYPGLAGLSAVPLGGDMGAYWNQLALHDAAPTYGPFANFGKKPLPIAPSGILGA